MSLFLRELDSFVSGFESRVASCPTGDIDALAGRERRQLPRSSALCALDCDSDRRARAKPLGAKIVELKRAVTALNQRITTAVSARLPTASIEDCTWAVAMVAHAGGRHVAEYETFCGSGRSARHARIHLPQAEARARFEARHCGALHRHRLA